MICKRLEGTSIRPTYYLYPDYPTPILVVSSEDTQQAQYQTRQWAREREGAVVIFYYQSVQVVGLCKRGLKRPFFSVQNNPVTLNVNNQCRQSGEVDNVVLFPKSQRFYLELNEMFCLKDRVTYPCGQTGLVS